MGILAFAISVHSMTTDAITPVESLSAFCAPFQISNVGFLSKDGRRGGGYDTKEESQQSSRTISLQGEWNCILDKPKPLKK